MGTDWGKVIILNGTPRSGKSSIAEVIQNTFDGVWLNLGVDNYMKTIPSKYQPGIGLRPGGERPDMETMIEAMYLAMYESIAAHSRRGLNVVADVGHHDYYSKPLGILPKCAEFLADHDVLFVGVRCPVDIIMERRIATWKAGYDDGEIPAPVIRWQESVHAHGIYDFEADTSRNTPEEIAVMIKDYLSCERKPRAFERLAQSAGS